jgi:hypothetical protein
MAIDRSDFLILASTLAAGGAGGWLYRDRGPDLRPPPPTPAPSHVQAPAPSSSVPPWPSAVAIVDAEPAAACDDSQGTPEPCPSVGPADEGICPNLIYKRCQEFKAAFKPRVATNAVACLRALKGYERCDPLRINQCGHMALMSACPDAAPPLQGRLSSSADSTPAKVTVAADPSWAGTPVTSACETILKACNKPLAPTLADCRQTLAGLSDVGRANMVDCASQHCNDRGLYLCEAVPKTP